jgi:hypothetical protein
MAYWGHGGKLSMRLYWLGAKLSYISAIFALLLMFFKLKGLSKLEIILRYLSSILVTITLFLTTIIIVAWKSGF